MPFFNFQLLITYFSKDGHWVWMVMRGNVITIKTYIQLRIYQIDYHIGYGICSKTLYTTSIYENVLDTRNKQFPALIVKLTESAKIYGLRKRTLFSTKNWSNCIWLLSFNLRIIDWQFKNNKTSRDLHYIGLTLFHAIPVKMYKWIQLYGQHCFPTR